VSLESWTANGSLAPHTASSQELTDLLTAAAADLADARKDLSAVWRFAIAYNAALRLCTAALNAAGYRAAREQKHYRTIAALPLVLGPKVRELAEFLDHCRTKRHDVTYESLSAVTNNEAEELIEAVVELDEHVRAWLGSRIPPVIPEP
jgi:HEPN domain-containing protein